MNKRPVVSILLVTYNQEAYIGKALDSLLMQESPYPYEILVGEDCSTDRTRSICVEYAQKYPERIRLFLNEKNKGLIRNYFDLLNLAQGKYLADCGGDDYWLTTDKLKRQVELLEAHPEVPLVFGNWQIFYQKNYKLEKNKAEISADWFDPNRFGLEVVKDYLNKKDFPRVVLSTACFRKEVLKEFLRDHSELFWGEKVVCEDLPITLCLLLKGPFYQMKEEIMVYRMLEKSSSHAENLGDSLKGFSYKVLIQTLELAQTLGIQAKEIKPYTKKAFGDLIYYAFVSKDVSWMSDLVRDIGMYQMKLNVKQQIMFWCTRFTVLHGFVYGMYCFYKKCLCTK